MREHKWKQTWKAKTVHICKFLWNLGRGMVYSR